MNLFESQDNPNNDGKRKKIICITFNSQKNQKMGNSKINTYLQFSYRKNYMLKL